MIMPPQPDLAITLLRQERNKLLSECDWTQSRDVELSNDSEWKTYREELRDLPISSNVNNEDNLNEFNELVNITWPTKPE
tara:strand:+ start:1128 stop:1367 length:240 start_codon:yes stop_codon:yes gene_type:complete